MVLLFCWMGLTLGSTSMCTDSTFARSKPVNRSGNLAVMIAIFLVISCCVWAPDTIPVLTIGCFPASSSLATVSTFWPAPFVFI
jgi:hypothetical protein